MSAKALNDDEVLSEMNKMVAFIKQEAMEKAREIKVKADEEFAIEKAKLVKQEQENIDAQFDKKRKQAEVGQKIAQSTALNKSRLRLLQRREEHLQDLFTSARNAILELANDEGRYAQFLESNILQGFCLLLEDEVTIIVRKKDVEITESVVKGAKEQYNKISGRDVTVSIDGSFSDGIAGGIKMHTPNRRISLDNTLDERLKLLESIVLPEIRTDLYGNNSNRKFFT